MPIYKSKNGKGYRVEVNYTDSFGNRKKVVRQNKDTLSLKDAKQLEAQILSEINLYNQNNRDATMDDLYNFYTSVIKEEVKRSTLNNKNKIYRTHIAPYFANKKINKISLVDFQNWKLAIQQKGYSHEYQKDLYASFNAIINFAVKYEYINVNHLAKLGNFKCPEKINKKFQIWTKEEFDKFITVVRNKCIEYEQLSNNEDLVQWAYYVMYNIMFYCGCRKGEVYALKWSDIDLNNKTLDINKSLLYKIEKGTYIISTPKTRSSVRTISMPKQLVDVLLEHKERYSNVYGFNDDFFVCGGCSPLTDTKLADFKNTCAKEAGIKQIRIHEFRHSHASLLINSGVNVMVIKERLGHSSTRETLDTYSHLYEKTADEAIALLESLN